MALKPLNSVGGFSVGESPNNVIFSNGDFAGNKANFSGNIAALGLLTNNLYYANGERWDLQEAAGANGQIQFNTGDDFDASANLSFDSATNILTVTGNLSVTDTASVGNLRTDNLLYANGQPWDLQEAAGSNNQIQYNVDNDFAASANLTYDDSTQQFTVLGNAQFNNANLGNLLTANFAEITSNIVANNITSNASLTANLANITGNAIFSGAEVSINNLLSGNTANFSGNVTAANFIGNIQGNITISAPDTTVVYSSNGAAVGSNNFTWNDSSNLLSVTGEIGVTGNIEVGGILSDNYYYANGAPVDFEQPAGSNTQIQFNDDSDFGASANLTFDPATDTLTVIGSANITTVNSSNFVGTGTDVTINANGFVSTFYGANGLFELADAISVPGNAIFEGAEVVVDNDLIANTANFSGQVSINAAFSVTGNVTFEGAEVLIDNDLQGNTATFSGNISALNSALGNLATANFVNVANDATVVGTLTAGSLVGPLENGTSNIRIFEDANVEVSVGGSANVGTFSTNGLFVAGEINSTAGNMLANGNVTANGFVNAANANISGEALVGSLKTDTINGDTDGVTITAAGSNSSISLIPTGTGTVSVNNFRISQVADPVDPTDATNKGYVDALAGEGLVIHTPVRVEADSELTATYAQGGTTPTVDSIANQSDITFTASHGLSVNDGIVFDNTFNGLTAGEAYWVAEVIDATTITVKDDYFNSPITNLTNGTSLAEASRANPGVGATLTNSGANAALSIDGIALSTSDRVLVYTQSNAYENGIYVVTTVGDGSTAWVLTRATDFNKYIPSSSLGIARNSYVFIEQGLTGAGESYVMTQPTGEIIVGTDNLVFTQFSAAGGLSAGDGINITGTVISANTDGITTAIIDGNIAVKANALFTTPNIGAATGTSLNVTGNVTANSLSITNIANIDLDLTVGGNVQVNGTISSNANVSGLNLTTSGNVQASQNVVANNITANTLLSAATANVSGNVNSGNVNITNSLQGNTATFSGNVVVSNLSVNLELSGNTANFTSVTISEGLNGNTATFTGNIQSLNANLGNLAIANFFTGTLIDGTSNIVISPSGNITFTASGNASFVVTDAGANVIGDLNVTGNLNSGNLVSNSIVANTVTANTSVDIGNTEIGWGSVTTESITANQTVAQFSVTGVTGVEFIVKGIDSAGSRFSVATVTAVTDGTAVDYVTYATATLGGATGSIVVNKVGSNIALQVSPSSSNTTVWTAQYRTI